MAGRKLSDIPFGYKFMIDGNNHEYVKIDCSEITDVAGVYGAAIDTGEVKLFDGSKVISHFYRSYLK